MNLIAERLKNFRIRQNYNQEGVAKIAGMSQRAWAGWEESPPKALQSLVDLSRHYGVSTDYLLNLTEDPTPKRGNLSADVQALIQVALKLSDCRVRDLILIAEAFAEEERGRGDADSPEGAPSAPPPHGPRSDTDIQAAKERAEAGIDAAMNMVTRKYGIDVAKDLRSAMADSFPDLASLIGPTLPSEYKGIDKS